VGLKERARLLKAETYALYLVARDPRTPWYAKSLAVVVVGYALSPIDLIPDFIPVLGYLDDLLLVPLGIWTTIRLVPDDVMAQARARAAAVIDRDLPVPHAAAVVIVIIWAMLALLAAAVVYRAVT